MTKAKTKDISDTRETKIGIINFKAIDKADLGDSSSESDSGKSEIKEKDCFKTYPVKKDCQLERCINQLNTTDLSK